MHTLLPVHSLASLGGSRVALTYQFTPCDAVKSAHSTSTLEYLFLRRWHLAGTAWIRARTPEKGSSSPGLARSANANAPSTSYEMTMGTASGFKFLASRLLPCLLATAHGHGHLAGGPRSRDLLSGPTSAGSHGKTIVGYYASWQW